MTVDAQDPELIENEIAPSLPMTAGGTVDVQVATARRYPRSITSFIRRATEMATLTPEIAASCVYALPRGGKTIEGPSARLAEIVASAWGNLRVQAGATDNDQRYITARGEAWDVETNVAIGFEVRRRITNRKGETYDDDMITVTGNAAASIALRNAVFKAVPSSFWKPIYQKCRQVIAGDAKTFAARRDEMLKAFMVAGVTAEQLCAGIGLKGVQDITLDHMATLVGVLNAIKEGETTIEEAFPEGGGLGPRVVDPVRRSEKAAPSAPASQPSETAPPAHGESGANSQAAAAETTATTAASAPTAAAPSSAGPGQVTKNVKLSDYQYVTKSKLSSEPYYELKGEEIAGGKMRAGHTWVTADEQLAKLAISCVGSETLFTITWHLGLLPGAAAGLKPVRIVTGIAGA